jgi:SAM-dependent methyltransferase
VFPVKAEWPAPGLIASDAGEAWRQYYQKGSLWCDPDTITAEYIVRWTKSEWITRILKSTGVSANSRTRVLEAGCGTGLYAVALGVMGFSVDAFDYNNDAIAMGEQLLEKVRCAGYEAHVTFHQDDLLNIHSADETYDLVFNQAVLEYFCDEDQRTRAWQQMTRVTKTGGWVAAIVQHTAHPFRKSWSLLGWPGYVDQPPVTDYSPEILKRDLRAAGLARVRIDGVYPWKAFFYWPRWYQTNRWTHEFIYLVGQGLNRLVPMPSVLRSQLATQILGVGCKL